MKNAFRDVPKGYDILHSLYPEGHDMADLSLIRQAMLIIFGINCPYHFRQGTKQGVQMAGMIFQTHSRTCLKNHSCGLYKL